MDSDRQAFSNTESTICRSCGAETDPLYSTMSQIEGYELTKEINSLKERLSRKPIETAPLDRKILLFSNDDVYVGFWGENIETGDTGWVIARYGDYPNMDCLILNNPSEWMEIPGYQEPL